VPWFRVVHRPHSRVPRHGEVEALAKRSQHLADARETLAHAAELASVLEDEIRSKQAMLDAIEADIAANRVLASIEQSQAATLVQLLDDITTSAHHRLRRAGRVDQIAFFFAGAIVSTILQLVMDSL
jgi:hypothetical protein